VFFRYQFKSGFDKIVGDAGDARLGVFLHEHWIQVFRGQVSWTSPRIFYPLKGVLGYTDTYFLNEVIYAPLRAMGLDQFLAFQWTLILMSLVGFTSLVVLLGRTTSLGVLTRGALATVFAFANNVYIQSAHVQLLSVFWLPLLAVVVMQGWRSARRAHQMAWGGSAGLLLGLLFFSTYYIAWFATLTALIFFAALLALRVKSTSVRACLTTLSTRVMAAIGFLVGFAVAMVPFAITYLPVLGSFGGRTYESAMAFAARPGDLINVGGSNVVWGRVLRGVLSTQRLTNGEIAMALTPELVVAALAAATFVLIRRRKVAVGLAGQVCVSFVITLTVLTLLPVKFGWGSLWRIPFTVVPGASGIRAIDRIMVLGGLYAVGAIAAGLEVLNVRSLATRRGRLACSVGTTAVLALAIVAQLNTQTSSLIDRSDEMQALILVPTPPPGCAAFYVVDSRPNTVPFYQANIDAMLISQRVGIPTLNGYSGQFPKGYTMIYPDAGEYSQQVQSWATTHHIAEGLCSYDRAAHTWTGPEA
jgi:hypothetical protein